MIRRPPRSTPFPTRRSSDLPSRYPSRGTGDRFATYTTTRSESFERRADPKTFESGWLGSGPQKTPRSAARPPGPGAAPPGARGAPRPARDTPPVGLLKKADRREALMAAVLVRHPLALLAR